MGRVLVTPPTEEPLSIAEAKLHLRIDEANEEDDGLIGALIQAARVQVENETGRALLTQTWKYYLDDRFPHRFYRDAPFVLAPSPIQSVTHIKYYDTGGVLTTLPTTDYFVDVTTGQILLPYGKYWPGTLYPRPSAVEVQFVAGYTDVSKVPPTLKAAMKLLIGTLYENRESVIIGTISSELPNAVEALLAPHRVLAVA